MMNVVTVHLYGSLDSEIIMKLPTRFNFHLENNSSSQEDYLIILHKSLYGVEQSERMWYNSFNEQSGCHLNHSKFLFQTP